MPGLNVTGDELLHDLVGATVDALHTAINERTAHGVLPHVAPATVELDALIKNLHLQIREPVLGHGSSSSGALLGGVELEALVEEGTADAELGLHLSHLVADGLEVGKGLAERLALLDVGAGLLVSGLGSGETHVSDQETLLGQLLHEVVEALVDLAEHVGVGNKHVVEEQLAGVLSLHAHLLQLLALVETSHAFLDKEEGDTVGALCGVSLGSDHDKPSHGTVGDEHLGAVEDPTAVHLLSVGLDAGDVTASAGLGHREGTNGLTAGHLGEVLQLLILSAVVLEVGHHDVGVKGEAGASAARVGLLLPDDGAVENVGTGTTILVRGSAAKKTRFTGLEPNLLGNLAFSLPLVVEGLDLLLEELASGLTEHVVVLGEDAAGAKSSEALSSGRLKSTLGRFEALLNSGNTKPGGGPSGLGNALDGGDRAQHLSIEGIQGRFPMYSALIPLPHVLC
eukprot:Colp12_sorted_trinity150504_noHs@10700